MGLLVDAEWTAREQRKLSRRLRAAKLRYPACLENVNFQAPRGLNREQILSLGNCRFVGERHNLLITGPTGIGKSFLACAFVERACRRGFTGCYVRAPRLLHELAVARGDGSYARLLTKLAKLDLLAIDDWLLHPLKESERRDLMEVIEDRAERGYFFGETTASRQAFATRNLTTVFFGIRICSPVWGLRPLRAFRCAFTSFPIPGMMNWPVRFVSFAARSAIDLNHAAACFFGTCIVSDIWATICVLVMGFFAIPQVSFVLKLT